MTTIALVAYGMRVIFYRLMLVPDGYQTEDGFFYGAACRADGRADEIARMGFETL
jgi:hypothetical protein